MPTIKMTTETMNILAFMSSTSVTCRQKLQYRGKFRGHNTSYGWLGNLSFSSHLNTHTHLTNFAIISIVSPEYLSGILLFSDPFTLFNPSWFSMAERRP